jgi:signal transduction histidine kinase
LRPLAQNLVNNAIKYTRAGGAKISMIACARRR